MHRIKKLKLTMQLKIHREVKRAQMLRLRKVLKLSYGNLSLVELKFRLMD